MPYRRLLILALSALLLVACTNSEPADAGGDNSVNSPNPRDLKCESDADCDGRCDPIVGCVECLFASDCGEGELCFDRACEAVVACSGDGDCVEAAGGAHCFSGVCSACAVDEHCGEAESCEGGRCESYEACVNSLDCTEGKVCQRDAGRCVECVVEADCPGGTADDLGEACVNNSCTDRCKSDNDCLETGQLCNIAGGYCAQCSEDVDCPDVYHCARGVCAPDVCEQGTVRCVSTTLVSECGERGDFFEVTPCSPSHTCVEGPAGVECRPWECAPGARTCAGSEIYLCGDDGLSRELVETCDEGFSCVAGECQDTLCAPNTRFCSDDGNVRLCSVDGLSSFPLETCPLSYVCHEGACKDLFCAPGRGICQAAGLAVCNDDGLAYGEPEPCGDDQVCTAGQCQDVICTPSERRCNGAATEICNASGTNWTSFTVCSSTQYCDAGYCQLRTCTPGATTCDGDVVKTCNAQGSGVEAGGVDCTSTGQRCWGGTCRTEVCTADSCNASGQRVLCRNNGTSTTVTNCYSGTYCDAGVCEAQVCSPGSSGCVGTMAGTCNAEGSGLEAGAADCNADGKVCYLGACLPKICEPDDLFCSSGDVMRCGSAGATSTLYDGCAAGEYCDDTGATAACATDVCTQGQTTCDGNRATTCNADGSGYEAGGTDCGADVCFAGACETKVCDMGDTKCEIPDGFSLEAAHNCADNGSRWTVEYCSSLYYCDADYNGVADCRRDVCTAGQTYCHEEALRDCKSDGSGYEAATEDCAAKDQICVGLTCVAEHEDTFGGDTGSGRYFSGGGWVATVHDVTTTRKLTEIEMHATVAGTQLTTFFVYEYSYSAGYVSRLQKVLTTSAPSGDWISSGPVDVTLEAGKNYIIGAHVSGSVRFSYNYYGSYPVSTSYGRVTSGRYDSTVTATSPANYDYSSSYYYGYHQRLTTALAE